METAIAITGSLKKSTEEGNSMHNLPNPDIYLLEMQFMPWGKLMGKVLSEVITNAPYNGSVIDLMCGPGFLLDSIWHHRPDLTLLGIDIDYRYIHYASKKNPHIQYEQGGVINYNYTETFDCVVCTGSVHHLSYHMQPLLFEKMSNLTNKHGMCICADSCISGYANESDRQFAAAKLGYEYLKAVLGVRAPTPIINAALDILHNDVLADGEYKNSISQLIRMAEATFGHVEAKKVWPEHASTYGDYYLLCK